MASDDQGVLIVHVTKDLMYTQFPSIPDIGELPKSEDYNAGVRALSLHSSLGKLEELCRVMIENLLGFLKTVVCSLHTL